jgi:hypothetical protein
MTEMLLVEGVYKSTKCSHCKKDLSKIVVPKLVAEKPDLKAPEGVLDEL